MKTLIFILCFFIALGSYAQLGSLGSKIKGKVESRVNKQVDKSVDKELDKAQNKIDNSANKKDSTKTETKSTENQSTQSTSTSNNTAETPAFQSYSKYDFIPGEKVIYYEDFSQDNVGDFPTLWNTNGSAEVATTNLYPGHWVKVVGDKSIWTDNILELPDNYTIEFDAIPIIGDDNNMSGYDFRLIQCENPKSFDYGAVPGKAGFLFTCTYTGRPQYKTYINGDEGEGLGLEGSNDNEANFEKLNQKYHIAIWVQKSRIRLYQDQNKLIDLPKAFTVAGIKMGRIRFEEGAVMVTNIRIAVGLPDTRSKLLTEGKLVSYGIYFDVNKDEVKPESYGTLKSIADVLKDNPTVKIKRIGYTDSDGDDKANLDLSKRRAANVKNSLSKDFGIDASRMVTDGMGES